MDRFILVFCIFLILGIVSVSGCTDSNTGNKTYSGYGVTFNYPETWEVDENGNILTPKNGIGGISNMSIKEYAIGPPTIEASLESVAEDIQKERTGTYDKREITIAGVKGIEYIPTSPAESGAKRVDVYFAKGDTFYNVFLTTNNYEEEINGFNMIIDTLSFN